MCTNKPSNEIQGLLLKWMILTYDLLDGSDDLHALYGILFHFVENDVLVSCMAMAVSQLAVTATAATSVLA